MPETHGSPAPAKADAGARGPSPAAELARRWLAPAALGLLVAAEPAWAQKAGGRGPGGYFAIWKLGLIWVTFLCWVRHAGWVNADTFYYKIDHRKWNSAVVGGFLLALVLLLFIPWFSVGFPLLLMGYLAPVLTYVVFRNKKLPPHEKVLTRDHLRFWLSHTLKPLGIKIQAEAEFGPKKAKGPPVEFKAQGAENAQQDQINQLTVKQWPGFDPCKLLIADAVAERAAAVQLDYTKEGVAVQVEIDGMWHAREGLLREPGDQLLEVAKKLAARDEKERRKPQSGHFLAEFPDKKLTVHLHSEGVPTGEKVTLRFDEGAAPVKKIPEIGMREKAAEALLAACNEKDGLVIVAAPPGHGMRTTFAAVVRSMDRYMRSFVQVDPLNEPGREVENVPITKFDPAKNESPITVLPALIRKYPDAFVVRDVVNGESLNLLLEEVLEEKRMVFTATRAKDCAEALLRLASLKVSLKKLAPAARAVVCQRLARKLCTTCREAFEPTPQLLKQLGIPAGKVQQLYRPHTPQTTGDKPEKPCPDCNGLGYVGRVPFFETLVLTDEVRAALMETPKLDALRQAIRKSGTASLQEEGILVVARGDTSLDELKRVLTV